MVRPDHESPAVKNWPKPSNAGIVPLGKKKKNTKIASTTEGD